MSCYFSSFLCNLLHDGGQDTGGRAVPATGRFLLADATRPEALVLVRQASHELR